MSVYIKGMEMPKSCKKGNPKITGVLDVSLPTRIENNCWLKQEVEDAEQISQQGRVSARAIL